MLRALDSNLIFIKDKNSIIGFYVFQSIPCFQYSAQTLENGRIEYRSKQKSGKHLYNILIVLFQSCIP